MCVGRHQLACIVFAHIAGRFGDLKPTGKRSQVLGLQRVHVGGDGHITDVWLFRSGTQEEMELLVSTGLQYVAAQPL